jgi:hypothetical protein
MSTPQTDEVTGPTWDAIRAAGIEITKGADGWQYATRSPGRLGYSAGGFTTAEEALQEILSLLMGALPQSEGTP